MIEEEVHEARQAGVALGYWGFGGGFDARWYRLMHDMGEVVTLHAEVEEPQVMALKHQLLSSSSFASAWSRVERHSAQTDTWTVKTSAPMLVVLEGMATRCGPRALLRHLQRIRRDAPGAHVIADLPGFVSASAGAQPSTIGSVRSRWSAATTTGAASVRSREITRIGYRIIEDSWLSARPELRAPSGMPICSGMEALRVLRLHPADDAIA